MKEGSARVHRALYIESRAIATIYAQAIYENAGTIEPPALLLSVHCARSTTSPRSARFCFGCLPTPVVPTLVHM